MTFYDDEIRCPVQVDDLAAALVELAATAHHGPLHVAGADAVDRATFARLIAAAAGLDAWCDRRRPASARPLGRLHARLPRWRGPAADAGAGRPRGVRRRRR